MIMLRPDTEQTADYLKRLVHDYIAMNAEIEAQLAHMQLKGEKPDMRVLELIPDLLRSQAIEISRLKHRVRVNPERRMLIDLGAMLTRLGNEAGSR